MEHVKKARREIQTNTPGINLEMKGDRGVEGRRGEETEGLAE